jgi:crotonobetainyl-CoA:carnitine CoA-transferase CaiB-like acyl-CoA transferase
LTGEGQVVDVTLLGTGMWTISADFAAASFAQKQPPRHDRKAPLNPIWNSYRCSDGKWLLLGMAQPDPYWPKFCRMIGKPEWIDDTRYNTLLRRLENRVELTQAIESIIETEDRVTWAQRMDAAGLIWAPIAEMPDVLHDETVHSLGIFTTVDHPKYGPYETMSAPFRVRGADIQVRGPAPLPGSDTQQVLLEYGFSTDEIAELAANGVLG